MIAKKKDKKETNKLPELKLSVHQQRVKRNHKRIMLLYDELSQLNPNVSINKICIAIAEDIGWTREGVRNVVNAFLAKRANKEIS